VHGTKTCAYEIVEQLGWRAPDWVVLPAGSGTLLLGLHRGFREIHDRGQIDRIPRIASSQARNCNPLERHLSGKRPPAPRATLAEGVAVARPPRLEEMGRAIRESRGRVYSASERRIRTAMKTLWSMGLYVEPTSALALTGLEDLAAETSLAGRKVVVILTGSGLKFSGR
jgi:threonine synthase